MRWTECAGRQDAKASGRAAHSRQTTVLGGGGRRHEAVAAVVGGGEAERWRGGKAERGCEAPRLHMHPTCTAVASRDPARRMRTWSYLLCTIVYVGDGLVDESAARCCFGLAVRCQVASPSSE